MVYLIKIFLNIVKRHWYMMRMITKKASLKGILVRTNELLWCHSTPWILLVM